MSKTLLQIENIEADELFNRLDKLEGAIYALSNQPQSTASGPAQTGYITRREVASLFKISLVTVNDWTQKGILTAYKIGNRVFYKRPEVEASLVQKGGKYVR